MWNWLIISSQLRLQRRGCAWTLGDESLLAWCVAGLWHSTCYTFSIPTHTFKTAQNKTMPSIQTPRMEKKRVWHVQIHKEDKYLWHKCALIIRLTDRHNRHIWTSLSLDLVISRQDICIPNLSVSFYQGHHQYKKKYIIHLLLFTHGTQNFRSFPFRPSKRYLHSSASLPFPSQPHHSNNCVRPSFGNMNNGKNNPNPSTKIKTPKPPQPKPVKSRPAPAA